MFANAFGKIGRISYDGTEIENIFRDVIPVFNEIVQNYRTELYTIEGAPDPSALATLLYDEPEYYWIFLLLNGVVNTFEDWILSDQEVLRIAVDKWGEEGIDEVHHHLDADDDKIYDVVENNGLYYDVGDVNFERPFPTVNSQLLPVTNIEYLQEKNEENRQIEIISPEEVEDFVSELRQRFIDVS